MSFASDHPVRCARPGCPASFPGGKFSAIKAQAEGWFTSRQTGESWCPDDVPSWVEGWRARQRHGAGSSLAMEALDG